MQHERHRRRSGQIDQDRGNRADQPELQQVIAYDGEASHNRDAGRDEEDGHVFQEHPACEVYLAGMEHARHQQAQQQPHADDIAGNGQGEVLGDGIAQIADSGQKGHLHHQFDTAPAAIRNSAPERAEPASVQGCGNPFDRIGRYLRLFHR